ncbi:MAG: hypothetical protein ACRDPK_19210 [Carbonactinosporaceae bacterium]
MRHTLGFPFPGSHAEADYALMEQFVGPDNARHVARPAIGEDAHAAEALLEMGGLERPAMGAVERARRSRIEHLLRIRTRRPGAGRRRVAITATYPTPLASKFDAFLERGDLDVITMSDTDIAAAPEPGDLGHGAVFGPAPGGPPSRRGALTT